MRNRSVIVAHAGTGDRCPALNQTKPCNTLACFVPSAGQLKTAVDRQLCDVAEIEFSISIVAPLIPSDYQTIAMLVLAVTLIIGLIIAGILYSCMKGSDHFDQVDWVLPSQQIHWNWRNWFVLAFAYLSAIALVSPLFLADIPWLSQSFIKHVMRGYSLLGLRSIPWFGFFLVLFLALAIMSLVVVTADAELADEETESEQKHIEELKRVATARNLGRTPAVGDAGSPSNPIASPVGGGSTVANPLAKLGSMKRVMSTAGMRPAQEVVMERRVGHRGAERQLTV